jgi:hypothetical protein
VSALRYAAPDQVELIIFIDQIQFRFNSAEATPDAWQRRRSRCSPATRYDPNCRPVPGARHDRVLPGQRPVGAVPRVQRSRCWHRRLVADASDLSLYVFSYVPAQVFKLAVNDTGNVWFAVSSKSGLSKASLRLQVFLSQTTAAALSVRKAAAGAHRQLNGAVRRGPYRCRVRAGGRCTCWSESGTQVWLEKDAGRRPLERCRRRAVRPCLLDPAGEHRPRQRQRPDPGGGWRLQRDRRSTTTWTPAVRDCSSRTQAWSRFCERRPTAGVLVGAATGGTTISGQRRLVVNAPMWFGEALRLRATALAASSSCK